MRAITPDDDFLLLTDTPETPMQIGALQLYEVPDPERAGFLGRVREHLRERLPLTPLLCVRRAAPLRFSSDVWLDVADCDLERQVVRAPLRGASRAALYAFVAEAAMRPLDLAFPPFQVFVADDLADGGCAILIKVHHALTDGIGFQTILRGLTDPQAEPDRPTKPVRRSERAPWAPAWLAREAWRFHRDRSLRAAYKADLAAAQNALAHHRRDTGARRAPPTGRTSGARVYETDSLDLERLRAVGRGLAGTVNDVFLAICAGAVRRALTAIGDLPDAPLVANSARSYRRPEHGDFGNRIVALHPMLATHLEDPRERFVAGQASMRVELERSRLAERLLGAPETPFGPRRRADLIAERLKRGRVLPGDVVLSNVPGPAEPRHLAGFRQQANFPMPILASGAFLNITMRRREGQLDLGLMADADRLPDLCALKAGLRQSLEELEAVA